MYGGIFKHMGLRKDSVMKSKKNFAVLTLFVLMMLLISGCKRKEPVKPPVLPVSYTAHSNSYSVKDYKVENDDSGNTVITLYGSYGKLAIDPLKGGIKVPAWCEFESEGVSYKSLEINVHKEFMQYSFDVAYAPEIITVTNGETGDVIVSFVVSDTPQKEE